MMRDRDTSTDSIDHPLAKTVVQLPAYLPHPLMWFAVGSTILLGSAIASALVLDRYPALLLAVSSQHKTVCQIIATDPNPPLNVRSSPIKAPDNIVAKVPNGTVLNVVDRQSGWLRITEPSVGWVYEELTVTSCTPPLSQNRIQAADTTGAANVFAQANDLYQTGNLQGAIALAQTIAPQSNDYGMAQTAIAQWQRDWHQAEAAYNTAQREARKGDWQAVLAQVPYIPENRYWRGKITPLVKQAAQKLK
uniref:SH3 domain-containing protein n=1 Tax=Oscillatoriales cyanobacterium SpSt-418 TaxID=2282169 RepID=A0A7C3PS07_9CYAN